MIVRGSSARVLLGLATWLALGVATAGPEAAHEERMIAPGVRWERRVRQLPDSPDAATGEVVPCVVQIVEADLNTTYIEAAPVHADDRVAAAAPLGQQLARVTTDARYPVAAVNGDFFVMEPTQRGLPIGAVVRGGEIYHNPFPRSALILAPNRPPRIAILRMDACVETASGRRHPIHRINNPRGPDQMVLYTRRYGPSTRTSPMGVEAFLRPETPLLKPGTAVKAVVGAVQHFVGDAPILDDRWLLSGSGSAARWLMQLQREEVVTVRVDFDPPLTGDEEVIGGGPRLVRDGRVCIEDEAGVIDRVEGRRRAPRTAVGFCGRRLLLVTVDGRQPGRSVGMTLAELAELMVELGCEEALNLDGGGSTTMWVRGAVTNRPSGGGERAVANGLAIFSTAPKGPPVRLVVRPASIAGLAGAVVPLQVEGEDASYNPLALPASEVRWTIDPALGTIDAAGELRLAANVAPPAGTRFVAGELVAQAGNAEVRVPVRVYAEPARLELVPSQARVQPGEPIQLALRALDERGRPLALAPALAQWRCDPGLGRIEEGGRFVAGPTPGFGQVVARVGAVAASATIAVGAVTRLIEDFERTQRVPTERRPPQVPASVTLAEGHAASGIRALAIEYDFVRLAAVQSVAALLSRELGDAVALRIATYGDGAGVRLRARVRDAAGRTFLLDLARRIDWADRWRESVASIPAAARPPIILDAIVVEGGGSDRRVRGRLLLDDLRADYPPGPAVATRPGE